MKKKKTTPGKTVVFSKHIHSGLSAYQSGDKWVYLETTKDKLDFTLSTDVMIVGSKNIHALNLETISRITETLDMMVINLESDKTFYNRSSSRHGAGFNRENASKEEMNNLVDTYVKKGFSPEEPLLAKTLYNHEKIVEEMFRKVKGFVFPGNKKKREPKEFQGGLSDELFNEKGLQKYISSGGAYGYIGHWSRTFVSDRTIETQLRKSGYSIEQISNFMSHSAGRHFADNLGSYEEHEVMETIEKGLSAYMERTIENKKVKS